jgi:uncharacterized 2Fe-2S/4Fe-4S cluster protein (DUF4445 family)
VCAKVRIDLVPVGVTLEVGQGTALRELLAPHGVEFACDGDSPCGACRVRVLQGDLPISKQDAEIFTPEELADGWRLACRAFAISDLRIDCAPSDVVILGDESRVQPSGRSGLGVAVDVGTTTVVAQLIDLLNGTVLAQRSGLNPQVAHGADVMSRVRFALTGTELTSCIREFIGSLIADMAPECATEIQEVVLVGNTVMHHLFAGLDVQPLSHVPFASPNLGEQQFSAESLQWKINHTARIRLLPCIGGFVGSDILAGIIAVDFAHRDELCALIDLGTNGEIVLGNRRRLVCASTAAGTAFEAGSIKMGMRASSGALSRVFIRNGRFECGFIGDGEPRGICGSGLVDAVAAGLDLGLISQNGRFRDGAKTLPLISSVQLFQPDIRELQLAKAAIAAGLRILLEHWKAQLHDVKHVFLAGAFGNYVRPCSAARIGMIEVPVERVSPAGNTALRGAKMLFGQTQPLADLSIEHISLASDAQFQDTFVNCLSFPSNVATNGRATLRDGEVLPRSR